MDGLSVIFLVGSIIGIIILAWTYTPKGKKWLDSL